MSSQHHRPRSHNGGVRYKQRSRQEYGDSQQAPEQGLSNGIIILTFAIMIGCFAVLWPKIFSPMLFGEPLRQPKLDDEEMFMRGPHGREYLSNAKKERLRQSGHPEHPGAGDRNSRFQSQGAGAGRSSPPIRTVDKEWGGLGGPMPGMRPTMGGPGIQPQQPKGGGTMSVIMPIYTIAIVVFFVYTTMKVMFKNKKGDEDDDDDVGSRIGDNVSYDEDYYRSYIKQYGKSQSDYYEPTPMEESKTSKTAQNKSTVNENDKEKTEKKSVNTLKEETKVKENDSTGQDLHHNSSPREQDPDTSNIKEDEKSDTKFEDPKDLEIILLKARLEQTEKAMEKLIAQMSALANNNPQTIVNSEKKNDQDDASKEEIKKDEDEKDNTMLNCDDEDSITALSSDDRKEE